MFSCAAPFCGRSTFSILCQELLKQANAKKDYTEVVTEHIAGADGKVYPQINEDKKVMIQMHLVDAIQKKWRKLI